jgi:hypothetical protein
LEVIFSPGGQQIPAGLPVVFTVSARVLRTLGFRPKKIENIFQATFVANFARSGAYSIALAPQSIPQNAHPAPGFCSLSHSGCAVTWLSVHLTWVIP